MNQVQAGVFDRREAAQQARQELLALGIAPERIALAGGPDDEDRSVARSMSVQASIEDLVRSLFVDFGGSSSDTQLYEAALRSGGTALCVQADDAAQATRVREVMLRHGAAGVYPPDADDGSARVTVTVPDAARRIDRQQ
ncbi:hypothetical protein [Caldimonas thermodepolymerans]|jgi:hypothetical protein|uniref:Uncharacterized protein n=1 Tax=Caldimonas thermodepolymerans TaxID=215580 RepID=A0AA46DI10_9BURK|nr:hypothetical protein [Caldimonas thermodepolymerans]TCP09716.1 hypothetical protein EV676_101292 [Caldimonas thermodepolymerans]UZG49728.1 hypothetical protein ONS87_08945 [Caldimonas thermodepolymerans]